MSALAYGESLRRRNRKFLGFMFGCTIGDALRVPEQADFPEFEKLLQNDEIYEQLDIKSIGERLIGNCSTSAFQYLMGCQFMLNMKKNDQNGRDFFNKNKLRPGFSEAAEDLKKLFSRPDCREISLNCSPQQAMLRVVPVVLSHMDENQMIALAIRIVRLSHPQPVDFFPAVELSLLMWSMLSTEHIIPDVYDKLKKFMHKNRLNYKYHFYEYEQYRLRPLDELETGSGLWLWQNVKKILGIVPGRKWSDLPTFLSGIIKVKKQLRDNSAAGALAGLLLGASTFYGYEDIPAGLKKNLGESKIISALGKQVSNAFVQGRITIGEPGRRKIKVRRPQPQPERFRPFLMYQSTKELRCRFFTIVVKNEALQKKYPGGVLAYARKFRARFNGRITVTCDMGEIDDQIESLKECSISVDECLVFDCEGYMMDPLTLMSRVGEPYQVDLSVDWLKALVDKGAVYISYV